MTIGPGAAREQPQDPALPDEHPGEQPPALPYPALLQNIGFERLQSRALSQTNWSQFSFRQTWRNMMPLAVFWQQQRLHNTVSAESELSTSIHSTITVFQLMGSFCIYENSFPHPFPELLRPDISLLIACLTPFLEHAEGSCFFEVSWILFILQVLYSAILPYLPGDLHSHLTKDYMSPCTLHTSYCTLRTVHGTMDTAHCTQYTMYTTHSTLYTQTTR